MNAPVVSARNISAGFWQRLGRFMDIIYEPKQHLLFATLWFLSIQGLFVSVSGGHWRWGWHTLAGVVTMFATLFVLRAIDEVKDFAYDQQFNPERPLVCGAISLRDVRWYVGAGLVALALLNGLLSPWLALFIAADIGYGLLLLKLEKWLPRMNTSLFFNLLFTYPVSIALSVYALLQLVLLQGVDFNASQLLVIGCYVLAFLHFEITRKSMWNQLADPAERLYSGEIGDHNALWLGFVLAVLAVAGVVLINAPWQLSGFATFTGWLPLVCLVFALLSVRLFYGNRQQRFNPRKFSVPFIVSFYLFNLVHGLMVNQHGW